MLTGLRVDKLMWSDLYCLSQTTGMFQEKTSLYAVLVAIAVRSGKTMTQQQMAAATL